MVDVTRRSFVGAAAALPLIGQASWADARQTPAAAPRNDGAVHIDYNESPWGPSQPARQAMAQGIALSGRYPYELQSQLTELFAQQQGVPADHVRAYCGSRAALQAAVMAFTGPRSLVMADPSYELPMVAAKASNAPVYLVPLDTGHSHDVEAMLSADANAGLVYICNPNNPTGTLTSRKVIEWAVGAAPKGSVVLVDEAYIHFADVPSCIGLVKEHANLLVLRSFSKLYGMAGARLGLAVAQPALLRQLEEYNGANVTPGTSLLGGIASLEDGDLVPERKHLNAQLRDQTIAWLQGRGHECTQSFANCFMVDVGRPADKVVKALADRNVMVGRVWPSWPNSVRVSVGTEQEMQRFREAFGAVMG